MARACSDDAGVAGGVPAADAGVAGGVGRQASRDEQSETAELVQEVVGTFYVSPEVETISGPGKCQICARQGIGVN